MGAVPAQFLLHGQAQVQPQPQPVYAAPLSMPLLPAYAPAPAAAAPLVYAAAAPMGGFASAQPVYVHQQPAVGAGAGYAPFGMPMQVLPAAAPAPQHSYVAPTLDPRRAAGGAGAGLAGAPAVDLHSQDAAAALASAFGFAMPAAGAPLAAAPEIFSSLDNKATNDTLAYLQSLGKPAATAAPAAFAPVYLPQYRQ